MQVQIFTSVVGGGHRSVAAALAEALADLSRADLEVWVDDLYVDLARWPASRFPRLYAAATRDHPWIWRTVYRLTNRPPGRGRLELLGDPIGGPRLGRLLVQRRPDTVVSTLPGVNGFVARSLGRHGLRPNLEVIVTDWADVHLSWVARGVSHYTVPKESVAQTCRRAGVPPTAIRVLRLPLRRQLAAPPDVRSAPAAREAYGLRGRLRHPGNDRHRGSARALDHLAALTRIPLDADIVVVCGRNERLREQVRALGGPSPVHALGFIDEVAALMRAADLLVTKPRGVTLAEAFCVGLPVLAFDPLAGQEEANARFAVAHGAAELAQSPRHVAELATELRWSAPRRAELAGGGARLRVRPLPATPPKASFGEPMPLANPEPRLSPRGRSLTARDGRKINGPRYPHECVEMAQRTLARARARNPARPLVRMSTVGRRGVRGQHAATSIDRQNFSMAGRRLSGSVRMRALEGVAPGWGITVVRVTMGIILVAAGYSKFAGGLEGFSGFLSQVGFPAPGMLGPLVATLELVGGLLLIAGAVTRWVALLFVLQFLVVAFVVKLPRAGWDASRIDLMILAGALMLLLAGPGKAAVDEILLRRRTEAAANHGGVRTA